jgi:hypothetical protein
VAYLNPAVLNLASATTGAREAGPAAPPQSGDRLVRGLPERSRHRASAASPPVCPKDSDPAACGPAASNAWPPPPARVRCSCRWSTAISPTVEAAVSSRLPFMRRETGVPPIPDGLEFPGFPHALECTWPRLHTRCPRQDSTLRPTA